MSFRMSFRMTFHPSETGYQINTGAYSSTSRGRHWLEIASGSDSVYLHRLTPEDLIELGRKIAVEGKKLLDEATLARLAADERDEALHTPDVERQIAEQLTTT